MCRSLFACAGADLQRPEVIEGVAKLVGQEGEELNLAWLDTDCHRGNGACHVDLARPVPFVETIALACCYGTVEVAATGP